MCRNTRKLAELNLLLGRLDDWPELLVAKCSQCGHNNRPLNIVILQKFGLPSQDEEFNQGTLETQWEAFWTLFQLTEFLFWTPQECNS